MVDVACLRRTPAEKAKTWEQNGALVHLSLGEGVPKQHGPSHTAEPLHACAPGLRQCKPGSATLPAAGMCCGEYLGPEKRWYSTELRGAEASLPNTSSGSNSQSCNSNVFTKLGRQRGGLNPVGSNIEDAWHFHEAPSFQHPI